MCIVSIIIIEVAVVVIITTITSVTLRCSPFIITIAIIISQMLLTFLAKWIRRIETMLASTRARTIHLVTSIAM